MKNVLIDKHSGNKKSILDESLINENNYLKERIEEYITNEKQLIEVNQKLEHKIEEYEHTAKRSDSSSSSSSNETVIPAAKKMEVNQALKNQIEVLKQDYADLEEKYEYEKHELQTMIEQLREEVIDLDRTKQLYIGKRRRI